MAKTAEEVVNLYKTRMDNLGEMFMRMREVQQVMNGEVVLPLPELSDTEESAAVANLARQGMQGLARRISSVEPTYYFPSLNPGNNAADNRARDRLRVATGWRWDNKLKRRLAKRSRYFLAYATCPVIIKPDKHTGLPQWIVKDPLHTFPADTSFDSFLPDNCIFSMTYTWGNLLAEFGQTAEGYARLMSVTKPSGWNYDNDLDNYDRKFDVLEYIDGECDELVLMGSESTDGFSNPDVTSEIISYSPNPVERCLVVTPGSIDLDKQLGHFDGMLGMYQTQAALMALTIIGQRRAVWPREWLVANPGEHPSVITIPDPATGEPGVLKGGQLIQQKIDPAFGTLEIMDRLAQEQRIEGTIPAEFGGMAATNVRTGRRGAQIIGATIDFTIAEAQDIFAESLYEETRLAIATDKAYWGNHRKVYQIATRSYAGEVKYQPNVLWESDKHVVDYPIAGTDLQNLPIEGGQRVAMQTMSREGFMEIDPVIKDPKAEIQRILREGVQVAFLSGIQQLAGMPDGPYQPEHLARLDEKLAKGQELYEAVMELQHEIQQEQATPTPDPAEQQPGLSMPGQGVEQPASIPEGEPSMQNLTALLGRLGTAQTAQRFRPTG